MFNTACLFRLKTVSFMAFEGTSKSFSNVLTRNQRHSFFCLLYFFIKLHQPLQTFLFCKIWFNKHISENMKHASCFEVDLDEMRIKSQHKPQRKCVVLLNHKVVLLRVVDEILHIFFAMYRFLFLVCKHNF